MTLWHDLGDLPEVSLVVTGAGTSLGWGSVGLLPLQPQVFLYWSLMAFFIFFWRLGVTTPTSSSSLVMKILGSFTWAGGARRGQ